MTDMPSAAFFRCGSYERDEVEDRMGKLLESLGGMERFVRPGESVLLKPNLLSASSPERCITTHPEVVRAAALRVQAAGGHPFIGDSPGLDGFSSVGAKTGMEDVAGELGIPCVELDDPVPLPMAEGSVFQRVEVSRKALEADKIINLPKLKTHAQMMLTMGVKNLFGTVVRQEVHECQLDTCSALGQCRCSPTFTWTSREVSLPPSPSWTASGAWKAVVPGTDGPACSGFSPPPPIRLSWTFASAPSSEPTSRPFPCIAQHNGGTCCRKTSEQLPETFRRTMFLKRLTFPGSILFICFRPSLTVSGSATCPPAPSSAPGIA